MATPTPRAQLKAHLAAVLNVPGPYVIWKGEPEASPLKPPTSFAITGATNATPIVLTVSSTKALVTGHKMTVAGVLGNTAANGPWSITVIDSTHVSLDGSVGNGAYTSGGTMTPTVPFVWAMLRVGATSREMVGWDNIRRTDNLDGTYAMQSDGRRKIILALDLFSFEAALSIMADDLLEKLRADLWRPDNLAKLNAFGLAYETTGPILPLPTSINGAEISAAHVDLTVALGYVETSDDTSNKWIGEVTGTGTVTDEQGQVTVTFDVTGG